MLLKLSVPSTTIRTYLFRTRVSVKCLASLPNLSGGTSVEAADAASLCAVVSCAGVPSESSPFAPSAVPSVSATTVGAEGRLPMDGACTPATYICTYWKLGSK
uniref:Uncharacterized protein n=1 Tax=Arundo donax TaxID=35708 RepID=A0A0A9AK94_ARUDO